MLRGLLLGVSWGGLVAATAVTSVSLVYSNANRAPMTAVTPEVETPQKPDVAVEPTVAPTVAETDPVVEPTAPVVDSAEVPAQEPTQVETDEAETSLLANDDTAPAPTDAPALPAVSASDAPPVSDAETAQAPDVTIPVETNDEDVVTANDEATPAATPALGTEDAPVSPAPTASLPDTPQSEAEPQAKVEPQTDTQAATMTAPAVQDAPATQDVPESGDVEQAELLPQADAPDVQQTALPQVITPDQPQTPQQDATLAVPSPAEPPVSQTPTQAAPEPATPASEGLFDTSRVPVPKINNLAPNVKTNRLPSIGSNSDTEVGEVGQETTPEPDKGALMAHAMTFENPDAKPMFSVVLIDDPQHPIADDALSHLPFALSFAVDAVRDDAYAVAKRYRAAGFEVLMLTNLPSGANATDVEVAFGAYTRAIPEAIGVLDLGANGFLRGPSTATQIAGIMSEKGYGLITPSKGLNSAHKAAMREGVPAALVFRELDADGEKPSVIRRYLDRAAFRAAQEGSVIMLGHTRPDTIEALVTWALEDRAASVAIAPVSAVLLGQ